MCNGQDLKDKQVIRWKSHYNVFVIRYHLNLVLTLQGLLLQSKKKKLPYHIPHTLCNTTFK